MEWISVKKKKPEKDGFYLATDGEIVRIALFCNNRFPVGNVTHWMPTPQPPKKE